VRRAEKEEREDNVPSSSSLLCCCVMENIIFSKKVAAIPNYTQHVYQNHPNQVDKSGVGV
jgi:hypothetical protein